MMTNINDVWNELNSIGVHTNTDTHLIETYRVLIDLVDRKQMSKLKR